MEVFITELELAVDGGGGLIPELLPMVWTIFSWTTGDDVFLVVVAVVEVEVRDVVAPLIVWLLLVLNDEELAMTVEVVWDLQVVVAPDVGQGLWLFCLLTLLTLEVGVVTTHWEEVDGVVDVDMLVDHLEEELLLCPLLLHTEGEVWTMLRLADGLF